MLDDVGAVLQAAGSERAVLFGEGTDGGGSAAVFAAAYPKRSIALIWWHGWSRSAWAPDYPWGFTEDQQAAAQTLMERAWGTQEGVVDIVREVMGSRIVDDTEAQHWWAKLHRNAATPSGAVELAGTWYATDVRVSFR